MQFLKGLFCLAIVAGMMACSNAPTRGVAGTGEIDSSNGEDILPEMVEAERIVGIIKALGGESDIYFIDHKIGRIYLENIEGDAKMYNSIRDSVGRKVSLLGTWNESHDRKLVFVPVRLKVVRFPGGK